MTTPMVVHAHGCHDPGLSVQIQTNSQAAVSSECFNGLPQTQLTFHRRSELPRYRAYLSDRCIPAGMRAAGFDQTAVAMNSFNHLLRVGSVRSGYTYVPLTRLERVVILLRRG